MILWWVLGVVTVFTFLVLLYSVFDSDAWNVFFESIVEGLTDD